MAYMSINNVTHLYLKPDEFVLLDKYCSCRSHCSCKRKTSVTSCSSSHCGSACSLCSMTGCSQISEGFDDLHPTHDYFHVNKHTDNGKSILLSHSVVHHNILFAKFDTFIFTYHTNDNSYGVY